MVYAFPRIRSPRMRHLPIAILSACLAAPAVLAADAPTAPPAMQALLHDIGTAPSAERIESDIRKLVSRSEEHTSELQQLMRSSDADVRLTNKNNSRPENVR